MHAPSFISHFGSMKEAEQKALNFVDEEILRGVGERGIQNQLHV